MHKRPFPSSLAFRTVRAIAAAAGMIAAALPAAAQSWPERPVKLIIPHSAGGAPDVLGRMLAKTLGEKLGQPFVVENRVGANGNIGTATVARAAADGYTLQAVTAETHGTCARRECNAIRRQRRRSLGCVLYSAERNLRFRQLSERVHPRVSFTRCVRNGLRSKDK